MDKADLIDKIRKVCRIRNDIKIDMTVKGENWFFDAIYVFLGETEIDFHNVLAVMNGNIKIKKSNCSSRTVAPVKTVQY